MFNNQDLKYIILLVGVTLLVACCESQYDPEIYKQTLGFQRDSGKYQFVNCETIYGLGTPFDYAYLYDDRLDRSFVYMLIVINEGSANIIKHELIEELGEISIVDTFKLSNISIESSINSLYLSVTDLDSFVLFKNSNAEKDTVYFYFQDELIKKKKFMTQNNGHLFVTDYNIRFNKIISSKYVESIYPIYTRHVSQETFIDLPLYMNSSSKKGLWPISEHHESLTENQFNMIQSQFSIHLEDKILHLDPSSEYIDTYYPLSEKIVSTKIPSANFDEPIIENSTKYVKVLEKETDYWFDFMYNPYMGMYFLFQHEGSPYFDVNGDVAETKNSDVWAKVMMLDSELNFVNSISIPYGEEFCTIINPKFPTRDGYVTIEVVSNNTDSVGTHYIVNFQKMLINDK